MALVHENSSLVVPEMNWLGLRGSEIFEASQDHDGTDKNITPGLLPLSTRDRRKAQIMLRRNRSLKFISNHEECVELQLMLMFNLKVEIEILCEKTDGLVSWLENRIKSVLTSADY
jgi:meiotic recombination protein SPO11